MQGVLDMNNKTPATSQTDKKRKRSKSHIFNTIFFTLALICIALIFLLSPNGKTTLIYYTLNNLFIFLVGLFLCTIVFSLKKTTYNNTREKLKDIVYRGFLILFMILALYWGTTGFVRMIKDQIQGTSIATMTQYDIRLHRSLKRISSYYVIDGTIHGERVSFKISGKTYNKIKYKNGKSLSVEYYEHSKTLYDVN